VALLAACGLPRDPEGTLDHVRGGVLRVGMVEDPPWASRDAQGQPRGVEVELTTALAETVDAEIRWNHGGETRLMAALERFELDLVIGGLDLDSAYAERVGFTAPYYGGDGHEHVLAVPPGENAWLMTVDRLLREQATTIPARLVRARVAEAMHEEAAP
jgi:hypothetical protein